MKLKEVLDKTTQFFKDKGLATPRLDTELLMAHGLKLERIQLYLKFDQPMREDELAVLRELVRRRAQGEPIAYILGYRDFYKYRFEVNSSVLIPRPETEHIIEEVLEWSKQGSPALDMNYSVVDLGAGSGCVGLTLLKELPNAKLISVDISPEAIEIAKKNARQLEVQDRVQFVLADASNFDIVMQGFKQFTGKNSIDILVANPPYISQDDEQVEVNVKKYEPHLALFAEDQGLALLKKWSQNYANFLAPSSCVVMEMGMSQGAAMEEYYSTLKVFNDVRVVKDLSGLDRLICGVKNG